MEIEHKKNTAYYLAFPMVDSTTPASFDSGASVSDEAYYKDGAGAWTSLAITDTVSEIGSTGVYEIDLTASELNHDQVLIKMTASGSADTAFLFNLTTQDIDDVSTQTSVDTIDTNVDAILVDTGTTLPSTLTTIDGKIDTVDTNVDSILVDTNELQGDWADGGRLDLILDARSSQTSVDTVDSNVDAILVDTGTTLPSTLTTIDGKIDTVDSNVDLILVDTGTTLPASIATIDTNVDAILVDTGTTLPASLATIDTNVDSILTDTGTTLPASIAALNDISVADVLTTQMTESYASDGTAPTLAQALFLIQQSIGDFGVVGTTITVRELDGVTTAATYTLDDGTNPTDRTRAT